MRTGASQVVLVLKNTPANAEELRDGGSIPGSERSPGVGNGSPLQYSCLENPMDRGAWRDTVHGVTHEKARRARGEGTKPLAARAARRGGKRHAAPGENACKPLATWAARRGREKARAPGERQPKLLAAWPEHGESSPHTVTSACSAPPSPEQD